MCHHLLPLLLHPRLIQLPHAPLPHTSVTGAERGNGRGSGTELLCRPLGTESEKERGSERGEEVGEAEEQEGVMETEQGEEEKERIWDVFRC